MRGLTCHFFLIQGTHWPLSICLVISLVNGPFEKSPGECRGLVLYGGYVEQWLLACLGDSQFLWLRSECQAFRYGLGWKGRSMPESCRSCKVFWARGFRDVGDFGLNTDWNCWSTRQPYKTSPGSVSQRTRNP